jgi:hypothetical protein
MDFGWTDVAPKVVMRDSMFAPDGQPIVAKAKWKMQVSWYQNYTGEW